MKWMLATSLAAAGLGLGACVNSSSGDVILPLAPARAATASVGELVLISAPSTVSAGFPAIFQREVRERLDKCARGARPLRMEVRITELEGSNVAKAYLVGDSNVIRAQVVLIEPGTGETVGDYEVSRSVGGGGLFAALAMAEAEEQMTGALATDICERAFGQD